MLATHKHGRTTQPQTPALETPHERACSQTPLLVATARDNLHQRMLWPSNREKPGGRGRPPRGLPLCDRTTTRDMCRACTTSVTLPSPCSLTRHTTNIDDDTTNVRECAGRNGAARQQKRAPHIRLHEMPPTRNNNTHHDDTRLQRSAGLPRLPREDRSAVLVLARQVYPRGSNGGRHHATRHHNPHIARSTTHKTRHRACQVASLCTPARCGRPAAAAHTALHHNAYCDTHTGRCTRSDAASPQCGGRVLGWGDHPACLARWAGAAVKHAHEADTAPALESSAAAWSHNAHRTTMCVHARRRLVLRAGSACTQAASWHKQHRACQENTRTDTAARTRQRLP
jgi:hypothetical protein